MSPHSESFQTTRPHERLMAAIAALTASVGITGALVLCLSIASPDQWAVPTPAMLAQLSRCEQQRARKLQDECKRQVAAAALAREPQAVRLAER